MIQMCTYCGTKYTILSFHTLQAQYGLPLCAYCLISTGTRRVIKEKKEKENES